MSYSIVTAPGLRAPLLAAVYPYRPFAVAETIPPVRLSSVDDQLARLHESGTNLNELVPWLQEISEDIQAKRAVPTLVFSNTGATTPNLIHLLQGTPDPRPFPFTVDNAFDYGDLVHGRLLQSLKTFAIARYVADEPKWTLEAQLPTTDWLTFCSEHVDAIAAPPNYFALNAPLLSAFLLLASRRGQVRIFGLPDAKNDTLFGKLETLVKQEGYEMHIANGPDPQQIATDYQAGDPIKEALEFWVYPFLQPFSSQRDALLGLLTSVATPQRIESSSGGFEDVISEVSNETGISRYLTRLAMMHDLSL